MTNAWASTPCFSAALRRVAAAIVASTWLMAGAPALAQSTMAQCRATLAPAPAARLRLCDEHAGCRAVLRIVDSCPALSTFLELLANNGSHVDDSVLRRTLIDAGVPANGLPSCTSDFNRALCRNFLNLEDASGETGGGPSRAAQFDTALRRLVEQQERSRVPADAHRLAEARLEACAAARPGQEREAACREAIEAVQACEFFRQEWAQRREVLLVDAQRLGRTAAMGLLRGLDMPSCPSTLPGSSLTPQQALVAAGEAADSGSAASMAGATAPGGSPPAAPPIAPPPERTAAPNASQGAASVAPPRGENGAGDCKTALRRMEERFETIQRRRPAQADRLATQQVEIYMLTEQMGVLERLCRNQREYDFLRPTQERLARALQACRAAAANPVNDCVPRVAW
jgi:hypothetical protein